MKRAKQRYYPLAWARGVADVYKGKHARATEILLEVYAEPEDFPALLLASGGTMWEDWKGQVKMVDAWLDRCPSWHDSCKDRDAIVQGLARYLQEDPHWDVREALDMVSHRVL